ncbi:MAG TPA: hypothetical protein GX707_01410 [Epulopiscium sp.]|nr:hypothetical protein [Candidatus Epulonipiscium sp.]
MNRTNESAWISFILGIIASLGWIIPIIGLPITVVGIALGAIGMGNSRDKGVSIAGMVINIIFLSAAVAKGIVDLVLYDKKKIYQ